MRKTFSITLCFIFLNGFASSLFAITLHDPIVISSNQEFTSENGVTNPWASGTQADPFIIENWKVTTVMGVCFDISNTSRFFVIKDSECVGANTGIRMTNVQNAKVETTDISSIYANPGQFPSGNGDPAYGVVLDSVSDIELGSGVKISYVYGGAGASGNDDSPDAGDGGSAYAVLLKGINQTVTINDLDISYIYGGAGGAGAVNAGDGGNGGFSYAYWLEGSNTNVTINGTEAQYLYAGAGGAGAMNSGNGGAGGDVTVLFKKGDATVLAFSDANLNLVYAGAGGAGAATLASGGNGGAGGEGGNTRVVRLEGTTQGFSYINNSVEYLYAGAGAAGAAGTVGSTGGNGGAGAVGGSVWIVDAIGTQTSVQVSGNISQYIYAGAGAVGGVGAMGLNGGDGSSGASGGDVTVFKFDNTQQAKVSLNTIENIFGAAGAVGSAGAVGTWGHGGNGGNGGYGGNATGIHFISSSNIMVANNNFDGIYGAAAGAGAVGASGTFGFGDGGDGGNGGNGIGIRCDDCSSFSQSGNHFYTINGGYGALGAIPGGLNGTAGTGVNIIQN